jgi:hypothetical protein
VSGEICLGAFSKARIEFDRCDRAGTAGELGQDRRVIADPSPDMDDMLAGLRRRS